MAASFPASLAAVAGQNDFKQNGYILSIISAITLQIHSLAKISRNSSGRGGKLQEGIISRLICIVMYIVYSKKIMQIVLSQSRAFPVLFASLVTPYDCNMCVNSPKEVVVFSGRKKIQILRLLKSRNRNALLCSHHHVQFGPVSFIFLDFFILSSVIFVLYPA